MHPYRRHHGRHLASPTNASSQLNRSNTSKTAWTPSGHVTDPRGGVRYVDVRVAIPADSPFPDDASSDTTMSCMARNSPATFSNSIHGSMSPISTLGSRCMSPQDGFIPIQDISKGRMTPPISPYMFKHGAASPSIMSTLTEDTTETSSMTLESSRLNTTMMSSTSPYTVVRRSPSPALSKGSGKRSPYPRNNDDDSVRKSRIKTELCMHYSSGKPCPFGAMCTYAHGEEELQMTKLMDLHDAGLVDKETYRVKPCLMWVATGSCPFGMRCSNIHDTRVAGNHQSWLPHTETQGNTMATDINVEALHLKRLNETLTNNPFGISLDERWSDLYKLVCNINFVKQGWVDKKRQRTMVHPIIKLQIALVMRGDSDWQYKYRPQHMIHEELCMVLQKRAFEVDDNMNVREISLHFFKPNNPKHVVVREIAFGPDSDPSVRGVALWFNIQEDNVVECTPQQAKRFRWKRSLKKEHENKTSAFDSLESFTMIRPHDSDAFDLATDMIRHRLIVSQTERIGNMRDRFEALQKLDVQRKELQDRFNSLMYFWSVWMWPVNKGREHVDKRTPAPKVNGNYEVVSPGHTEGSELGSWQDISVVQSIWNGFVGCKLTETDENINISRSSTGLKIFEQLAQGCPVGFDRTLPHIKKNFLPKNHKELPHTCQQERCWRALLLQDSTNNCMNEWQTVQDHFANSRSKKVLSIIQQKKS